MAQATQGDTVLVHYKGTLDSGDQFDSSEGRAPLQFTLGQSQVIAGFENAVMGMAPGESCKIRIEAGDAYGAKRDDLIYQIDRGRIPDDVPLERGMQLGATGEGGQRLNFTVVDFNDTLVTLDANHPLAGEALTFEIELVDIV